MQIPIKKQQNEKYIYTNIHVIERCELESGLFAHKTQLYDTYLNTH